MSHPSGVGAEVLAEVAAGGASDAGGLPVVLLGDFLEALASAVAAGERISRRQLREARALGDEAACQGVALRALLDLYLSATWRLWRHLPAVAGAHADPEGVVVAGEVLLHAVDDVVAALTEGFQLARRALVRAQASDRRELVDDLLGGTGDVASVLRRAAGFGMDLSGPHSVAVVTAEVPFSDGSPLLTELERAVLGSKGDAQALVATRHGLLVVIFPAPDAAAVAHVVDQLGRTLGLPAEDPGTVELRRRPQVGRWQVGVGRPGTGTAGVATSHTEAREALDLGARLGRTEPVLHAQSLLVYQVLLRDLAPLLDLIETALGPLRDARGGAQPLVQTLDTWFACGSSTAETARRLHLSERAVTYRLSRVRELTGLDPAADTDRLTLQIAAVGATLHGWPEVAGSRK